LHRDIWLSSVDHIQELLKLLQDPSLKLLLTSQQSNKKEEEAGDGNIDIEKSVLPSLVSFLQKLDSELLKAF
jgi:hypothetical protein